MRIQVKGSSNTTHALRGLLQRARFPVIDTAPIYGFTITIDESADVGVPTFDSVDCELEREIVSCVTELVKGDVVLRRQGGTVTSDREMSILVPPNSIVQELVELGVLRGLLRMFPKPWIEEGPSEPAPVSAPVPPPETPAVPAPEPPPKPTPEPPLGWWSRLWAWLIDLVR